jgi:hypothetical protein
MILLPSIVNGPDTGNNIERVTCKIVNTTTISNFCIKDVSDEVFAFIYGNYWENCTIIKIDILVTEKSEVINCTYMYPESFTDDDIVKLTISKYLQNDTIYDCVYDKLKKICYPDKYERIYFASIISPLILLFLLSLLSYMILKKCPSKKITRSK